jgi:DNA modification methylase
MALKEGIYCGDSFRLLRRVTPGSVKLIIADPPYNVTRENNLQTMGRRGIEFSWDGEFDQVGWLRLAVQALAPGGAMVIFNDWKNMGLLAEALRILGMRKEMRDLHWRKANPIPRNMKRCFIQRMESALYAVKPGAKWTFNRDETKSYEDGIFSYPIQHDLLHETKKPDALYAEIIELLTDEGDLVLDPFAGSGTLAVAATRTMG